MKRYSMFVLIFVLTAALMTGCGCTGPTVDETKAPTVLPTNEEVAPTTRETTRETTQSTTETTMETATNPSMESLMPSETIDNGNGLLEDQTTGAAEESTATGRTSNR